MSDKRKRRKKSARASDQQTKVAGSGGDVLEQAHFEYDWRRFAIFALSVLALALAAHTIGLWGQLVYMDSYNLSPLNDLRDMLKNWNDVILQCLTQPLSQPLVKASFLIDVQNGRMLYPAVYKCTSLLIHIFTSISLFWLTLRISLYQKAIRGLNDVDPYTLAFAAASLFACHPLTCESVTYISARSGVMTGFFYIASLHFFLTGFLSKSEKTYLTGYFLCYVSVILAIWSGAQGITAPLAFMILALLLKPPSQSYKSYIFERPFEFFAQTLVAVVTPLVLLLSYVAPVGNGFGLESLPVASYVASQFKLLITYYGRCLLVPFGLTLDPPWAAASGFSDPFAILGLLIPFLALALATRLRNSPTISFALFWFVLSLIPFIFVVQPEVVSDRRIYLSVAALSVVAGWLMARFSQTRITAAIATGALVLILFLGLSNYRNYIWQKNIRLFENTLAINSDSFRSKVMLAWARTLSGEFEKGAKQAEKLYKSSSRMDNRAVLTMLLGTYYNGMKKYKKAEKFYKEGLKLAEKQNLSPELIWKMKAGLAQCAVKNEDYETAWEAASEALKVQPNRPGMYLVRGLCYLSRDNPNGAFYELQKAYRLDPHNAEVLRPLVYAAMGCGTPKFQNIGYRAAERRMKVFGATSESVQLLAYASLETGRVHGALALMKKYLTVEKPTAETYYILYGIYKQFGNDDIAAAYLKKALEMDSKIRKKLRLYLKNPVKDTPSLKLKEELEKKKAKEKAASGKDKKQPGPARQDRKSPGQPAKTTGE